MANVSATSASAAQDVLAGLARTESKAKSKVDDAQSRFLTLLTTQLKNQDPLSPMDNAQMTSQLAQISTVDGIERLNATLTSMMAGQQSSDALQAAELVGRGVLVPGSALALSANGAIGGYDLAEGADKVVLTITDANGLTVAQIDLGAQEAGAHNFTWDGTTASGEKAAPGSYKISVKATAGDSPVSASALQLGVVSSVVRGTSGVDLEVGALGIFQINDIMQIL